MSLTSIPFTSSRSFKNNTNTLRRRGTEVEEKEEEVMWEIPQSRARSKSFNLLPRSEASSYNKGRQSTKLSELGSEDVFPTIAIEEEEEVRPTSYSFDNPELDNSYVEDEDDVFGVNQ